MGADSSCGSISAKELDDRRGCQMSRISDSGFPWSGFQCGQELGRLEGLAEAGAEAGAAELVLAPAVHVCGHRHDRRALGTDRLGDREAAQVGEDEVEQ